jgi:uncharacterized membrane protein YbhN (UPF0104 family)
MSLRSALVTLGSLAVGFALCIFAIAISGVHIRDVLVQVARADRSAIPVLAALTALNTLLSSCKWRAVDKTLRGSANPELTIFESFTLTSLGTALGQFLPVHVSMPITRTLGTRVHGRAVRRGTLGTYFEQVFDFGFACVLMLASLAVYFLGRSAFNWLLIAVPSALVSVWLAGSTLSMIRRLAARVRDDSITASRWRQYAVELSHSGLLQSALGRKLMCLSALRFAVLTVMAAEVGRSVHADIPWWHFAFAMPAAILATAAGLTPGSLGVWEFSYVGALALIGTPLRVATTVALANRLLGSAAALLVAILATPLFLATRTQSRRAKSNDLGTQASEPVPHGCEASHV